MTVLLASADEGLVAAGAGGTTDWLGADVTEVTAAEGTMAGSVAGALELLAGAIEATDGTEATGAATGAADGDDVVSPVGSGVVRVERVGLPRPVEVIGIPAEAVAAAAGTAGFDTADDGRRGPRGPEVELEADARVADEVEELSPEVSAAAAPAVMIAAAVPIPSSTASAPTRPTAMP